ncbi:MAG: polymerase beta subunit [Paenibacillus sp.]|jgi:DNA polymerase-3 subunit beta|nr:polymerase beta subunit [Paenibacillus sp.]
MLVIAQQQALLKALQHVIKAVAANSPLPILTGILLDAQTNRLTLTASHTSLRIQYVLSPEHGETIHILREGRLVVPARYLLEIIRKLPPKEVRLEVKEGRMIHISSDSTVFLLSGMDAEEFPAMPTTDPFSSLLAVPIDRFRKLVRQVAFAVSTSEARPILTGVLCRVEHEQLFMVASDGVRLASSQINLISEEGAHANSIQVLIPGKTLTTLSKMLDDTGTDQIELAISHNQIRFRNQALLVLSVLLDGAFPSMEKLIPRTYHTEITLNSTILLQALEQACLLAGDGSIVKLSASSSASVELSAASNEIGNVHAEINNVSLEGVPVSIYFNGKYMSEILQALEGTDVTIRFSGKMNPIVIQPVESLSTMFLLTPIRQHESN